VKYREQPKTQRQFECHTKGVKYREQLKTQRQFECHAKGVKYREQLKTQNPKPETMKTPHIITLGTVQYQLGTIKNGIIYYDFPKIKTYLDAKGKLMFGKKFKLYPEDDALLFKLCSYFINDHQTCAKCGIDTGKGLLLSGPVGCGKTSFMKLLPTIVPHKKPFEIIPTRNIIFDFNAKGYGIMTSYTEEIVFCFDDLGVEPTGCHYGKNCNVMGEILLTRYDLYTQTIHSQRQIKTHLTTNLNAKELEDRYGSRLRSRLRESYNLISFDKNAKDKRIYCKCCLLSTYTLYLWKIYYIYEI